jgi:cell division protein FtsW
MTTTTLDHADPGTDGAPEAPPPISTLGPAGWDLGLVGATFALVVFGLIMVVSASSHFSMSVFDTPWGFGLRQLVGVGLGVAGGVVILLTPWRRVVASSRWVYAVTLLLLLLVQSPLGHAAKGAPRWLHLGPLNVQPSEIAKIALAMVLARHFAKAEGRIRDIGGVVAPALYGWLLPMLVLIHLQTDLGSMMLLTGMTGVALFVAGLELRWLFGAVAAAVVGVTLAILYEPFRARRVLSFLDPHADPEGAGYQVVQGWVAMAVGGLAGQGLGKGVAQQGFLPEAHTDMIMAVIAEELGVVGWATVMILHVIVLWRGMKIASEATGMYEMVLASCLSAVIGVQVFINTAVIGGLVPPKGLVLPFVSYGASAMMANLWAVALLVRIGIETERARRGEETCSATG